jgi:uncharacterized membrane protein YebE (DUF533 family)
MSEALSACRALAAIIRDHGTPNVEEVRFVAHAALELGLDPDENAQVQKTLQEGGDYKALLGEVKERELQVFLLRRLVSVVLIDEEVDDAEKHYIDAAGTAFGFDDAVVKEFVAWMREGLAWEQRGAGIIAKL